MRALKTKLIFTKENKIKNHWFIGVIHIEFANWVGSGLFESLNMEVVAA